MTTVGTVAGVRQKRDSSIRDIAAELYAQYNSEQSQDWNIGFRAGVLALFGELGE